MYRKANGVQTDRQADQSRQETIVEELLLLKIGDYSLKGDSFYLLWIYFRYKKKKVLKSQLLALPSYLYRDTTTTES